MDIGFLPPLLVIWKYLSAVNYTVRIMANESYMIISKLSLGFGL